MCKVFLALSVALVVWMGSALARVENERYALSIGMCWSEMGAADLQCLRTVQTRTHWVLNIYYALVE